MKVIIIKDCKDGKVNDIIDVSSGYATNFLIKTGLAISLNKKSKKELQKRLSNIEVEHEHNLEMALKVKGIIEKLTLTYKIKVTDLIIHGSITRKQIIKSLREKNINLDSKSIENVKITSLGISNVKITLNKEVVANLKVEVIKDGE